MQGGSRRNVDAVYGQRCGQAASASRVVEHACMLIRIATVFFLIDWRGIDTHVLLKVCFKVCMLMMNWQLAIGNNEEAKDEAWEFGMSAWGK